MASRGRLFSLVMVLGLLFIPAVFGLIYYHTTYKTQKEARAWEESDRAWRKIRLQEAQAQRRAYEMLLVRRADQQRLQAELPDLVVQDDVGRTVVTTGGPGAGARITMEAFLDGLIKGSPETGSMMEAGRVFKVPAGFEMELAGYFWHVVVLKGPAVDGLLGPGKVIFAPAWSVSRQ